MFNRVKQKANARLAVLAERVDDRLDRLSIGPGGGAAAKTLPTRATSSSDSLSSAASVEPPENKRAAIDPAAAKAFESVPKAELISLLAKTNSRCRALETRYAELQALHTSLLEEKRQLVASRGRSGKATGTEAGGGADHQAIERQIEARYADRLSELEEAVESSTAIKKSLQSEASRAASALAEAEAVLLEERARAESAAVEAARAAAARQESAAAEAARSLDAARAEAKRQETALLDRLMHAQRQLAAAKPNGSGSGGSADEGSEGWAGAKAELERFYESKAASAAAAARAAAEAGAARERELQSGLESSRAEAKQLQEEVSRWGGEAAAAAASAAKLKEELQAKDKALGRALSNYREEVLKWGSRLQALEREKEEEAERALRATEDVRAEMAAAAAEAATAASAALQAERTRHASEMETALAEAAREASAWRERLELAERRGAAEATAAERGRSETSSEWRARMEEERLAGRDRLRAAEADGLLARQAAARAEAERDELASRLDLVQKELLMKSEHSTAVQTKVRSAIASASQHEALVTKLEQQLQASEREYRTAKALRASLEAELSSARAQLSAGRSREESLARDRQADKAAAEEAVAKAVARAEAAEAAAAAAGAAAEGVRAKADAARKERAEKDKAHAAELKKRDERISQLESQLDSGKPSEAAMFTIARDQAKRDAEADKLRAQLKSLRQMLKESHRVLTHLVQQEGLLKKELANTRQDLERQEGLNVVYLKNVTVAFLLAIYGDAEDDEHIRLARVLATILRLSPDEVARLNAKIAEYTDSWWHRTSNLLKTDTHGAGAAGSFTGAISETFTAWPTAISEWFWGPAAMPPPAPPAAAAASASMARGA